MKVAKVLFYQEGVTGKLSTFEIEMVIPKYRRYGSVIRDYIEFFNRLYRTKIYDYQVINISKKEVNYARKSWIID
jgi:hypothetical protein